jgi:hypothetical protein
MREAIEAGRFAAWSKGFLAGRRGSAEADS